jgi:hypothetical protein
MGFITSSIESVTAEVSQLIFLNRGILIKKLARDEISYAGEKCQLKTFINIY